jgi:large repetitive protein
VTIRTRFIVATVLALALTFAAGAAQAAPPPNDNFANAVALPLDTTILGTTLDATAEAGEQEIPGVSVREDDCANLTDGSRCSSSVWYSFTVPSTGTYTVETCDLSTTVDTVMGVWTGSTPATLAIVTNGVNPVSDDDGCAGGFRDNGSQVSFTANTGTTYWVEVAGFAAAQDSFYLRAYAGAPASHVPEPDTFIGKDNSYLNELIGGGPEGGGPRQTASFEFTSDTAGATFQCSVDGSPFAACTSPVSLDGQTGTHTISVRAVANGTPDATPAVQTYTIDNTPPDTSIPGPPTNPTADPGPTIRSQSTERAYFDTYRCALDGQDPALSGCSAFQGYSDLCNGTHTFSSAAVDNANNVDPTPATTSFLETGGTAACAAPVFGAPNPTSGSATNEGITVPFTSRPGAGGVTEIDYGTTAAYGQEQRDSFSPSSTNVDPELQYLQPGTLYHYKITATNPFGTATTGDQTFTTPPLADTLPTVTLGTPVIVGQHAAAIPITAANPGTSDADFGIYMDDRGPINTDDSPTFEAFSPNFLPPTSGPTTVAIDVVDLLPGHTYHVAGFVSEDNTPDLSVLTPDIAFTIPAAGGGGSPPPPPPIKPFKFRKSFIKVGAIKRHSKTITLVIRNLPPSTSVGVTVNATVHAAKVKFLVRGKARANKAGVARVKMKLSRKARKVLLSKRTKSLSIQVRVKPPGLAASRITLHRKLKH